MPTGPMTSWWKVLGQPVLTPEVQKTLIDSVHAEVGSRSIDELAAERDEILLGLISCAPKRRKPLCRAWLSRTPWGLARRRTRMTEVIVIGAGPQESLRLSAAQNSAPLIQETLKDVYVHAHTFRFITPAATQTLNIPNPCTLCHNDKSVEWAEQTLMSSGSFFRCR
jgi:hypothetical protein